MANKRKPDAVLKLSGTFRKDRHGDGVDINYKPNTPEPPEILSGAAYEEWQRVVPELESIGLLTIFDRMILTQYCVLTAEFYTAQEKQETLSAAWHNQYKLIQQELGFTPSSRASMKLPMKPETKRGSVLQSGAM